MSNAITRPSDFSVSVILPVIDETTSLAKTVEVLLAENRQDISEILIVVCKKTSAAAREVCSFLLSRYPDLIRICEQTKPFLGGAMQDAFAIAQGSHVLMMASDLETDPHTVRPLMQKAKE